MMKRKKVIQAVIDKKIAKKYLEIGVATGNNFLQIKAPVKLAVDPCFRIPLKEKIKWLLANPSNLSARYFCMTSDEYFASHAPKDGLDVVYVDGLHTWRQALADIEHAILHLNEGGVIIAHDCNPSDEAMAWPAESYDAAAAASPPGWKGLWCGDVWKAVCYLRSHREDLNVFVLDCDFGLGVITKGRAESMLPPLKIEEMSYNDLAADRQNILNLKSEGYFAEFLKTL